MTRNHDDKPLSIPLEGHPSKAQPGSALLRLAPVLSGRGEGFGGDLLHGVWLERAMREALQARGAGLEFHLSVLAVPTDEPQGLICLGETLKVNPCRALTEGLVMGASGKIYARATAVYSFGSPNSGRPQ